jgi:glycosyltransferase involved in cell wall biosynthesis
MNAETVCLSIVIPTYNEESTLPTVVSRLRKALDGFDYQIVIVDDGSTDNSSAVLKELLKDRIVMLAHTRNLGKGAALRTAFKHAKGDIIVIQDADLEYDPRDVPDLIQPIIDGRADVVFGSRFCGSRQGYHFFWHRLANSSLTS